MSSMEKKQKILLAAEKIMGEKGINSTISEIAETAGINQSIIYHYYKNKEDLLFSVAEEHLENMRNRLEEELLGTCDTIEKLKKMIHFRLSYIDQNRKYGELYLFECRSNLNFYKHTAFNRTLWFISRLGEIIKEGVKKGIFDESINVWIARDTIYGFIDILNIEALVEEKEIPGHTKEIMTDLVLKILEKRAAAKNKKDKRLKIIDAAEKIFAQKGYEKAKIQDIAAAADVGDGTLYEYFDNKEALLFSVLKEGFKPSGLKKGFQTHLNLSDEKKADHLHKFEGFIRNHFLLCLTQPSFVKIFVLHGIYNRNFYKTGSIKEFTDYFSKLGDIIDDAVKDGGIREDINKDLFIKMIMGAFGHITLRWLISEDKVKDRVGEINQMTEMLLYAVTTKTMAA